MPVVATVVTIDVELRPSGLVQEEQTRVLLPHSAFRPLQTDRKCGSTEREVGDHVGGGQGAVSWNTALSVQTCGRTRRVAVCRPRPSSVRPGLHTRRRGARAEPYVHPHTAGEGVPPTVASAVCDCRIGNSRGASTSEIISVPVGPHKCHRHAVLGTPPTSHPVAFRHRKILVGTTVAFVCIRVLMKSFGRSERKVVPL